MQSLRVQSDKIAYRKYMQDVLLHQEHLQVREQCVERVIASDGKVKGVQLQDGHMETCRALIITSGTFMSSTILVGHRAVSGGPEGEPTTDALSQSLRDLGIRTFRLKTGTPARRAIRSISRRLRCSLAQMILSASARIRPPSFLLQSKRSAI